MELYWYRIKDALFRNPLHTAIIWIGYCCSNRWRKELRMAPQFCECLLGIDFPDSEDFLKSCNRTKSCLASALNSIAINAFRHWPIVGDTCRRMLACVDWQAIATRLMDDAWSDLYWEMELSEEE